MSSVHITFSTDTDWKAAESVGWMSQMDLQYHWENDKYESFDDFLMAMKGSKRKSIRQERRSVGKQGLRVKRLRGDDITEEVWDKFYEFYMDTSGAMRRSCMHLINVQGTVCCEGVSAVCG